MRSHLRLALIPCVLGLPLALSCCSAAPPVMTTPAVCPTATPDAAKPSPDAASAKTVILPPEASPITFEQMSRFPRPSVRLPRSVAYSPDGKIITFLKNETKSPVMTLFAFDPQKREARAILHAEDLMKEQKKMSREEELRRERQRMMTQGITSYAWAKKAPVMLIPFAGDVFVRAETGAVTRLTSTNEPEIDPQICVTGERVAFVRGSELYAMDVASRRETKLTKGAPDGVTRGQSDFNGQEEFDETSGFWMSPGCDKIAYLEVDEREVGTVPVMGYRGGNADLMMQKYPLTGGKNPKVTAGIVDVKTQKTTWIKWPSAAESYYGRFVWSHDNKALFAQALTRDQKRLSLVRIDPATGEGKEIAVDTSQTWVDFAQIELLEKTPRIVWSREDNGHTHLTLLDATNGSVVTKLTSGAWDVASIEGIDEEHGRVFFSATKDGVLEKHLYAAPLDRAGEVKNLTPEPGVHFTHVEGEGRGFVDMHSALDRMPKVAVRGPDGAVLGELPAEVDPEIEALRLRPPEVVEAKGPSGDALYGSLLKPRNMEPGRKYPLVVMIYGGPGYQTVLNMWQPYLEWNHLADRGVAVFQMDNRGTPGRGIAFERAIYDHFNDIEMVDQIAGLDELKKLPFLDMSRVGIYGGSYGGTMTLLALLTAPDRFKVGVSAAPVTNGALYDSGYEERYMSTPEKNPKGYERLNITKLAKNLQGKLLLIHGLMDENVHFQNSALMIDALIEAKKPFDTLLLPGERHGSRAPAAREYMTRRVLDYLTENL